MARDKKTKEIADRIDPVYFRTWHRLRKLRFFLSLGMAAAAALWIAGAAALGKETIFSNGPVAASHALFEADCARCHTEKFAAVQDFACVACHAAPPHTGADPACAHCHTEHRGRRALDLVDDAFCNACHKDHKAIQNFEDHLEFQPRDSDERLRFNHVAHMDPKLVNGPLRCGSCHHRERDSFAAIRFEEHCAGCHTERLDARLDDQVPHGEQPPALRDWIGAVLLRRLGAVDRDVILPGKGGRPPEWRDELVRRTDAALSALLRPGGGCLLCHVMEGNDIARPQIPVRWFRKARFDHHTHRFERCDKCHDMSRNTEAATLSLPSLLACQQCHMPKGAADTCVTCHPYHLGPAKK